MEVFSVEDYYYDEIYDDIYAFVRNADPHNSYGFYEWDADYIIEMCELDTSNIYLLISNDEIIGVMKVDLFDSYLYLSDILISKKERGNGYGRFFISEVMALEEMGEVDLNVDVANTDAIVFYLKIGFMITGYISKYYKNGNACLYMVKKETDENG